MKLMVKLCAGSVSRGCSVISLVLAVGCTCSPKIVDALVCDVPCYTASSGLGHAPCQAGIWYCSPENTPVCLGEVGPTEETCDNIDNDCDGRVDEPLWHYCSNDCGQGTETCHAGTWTACTAPLPTSEVCDGRDNDCDGKTDEVSDLPLEYCYTGPIYSAGLGECRPGFLRCSAGAKHCMGEVLPEAEICDGLDNDCNGEIDEGLELRPVDFVFVIDNSGSMRQVIDAVKVAVTSFATGYEGRSEMRWALFGAPDNDPAHDGQVRVVTYLTDVGAFNTYMQLQGAAGGGMEPMLDALVWLAHPGNVLGVDWTPGAARHVLLFTDEPPQSYATPPYTQWDSLAAILFAGPEFRAHMFVEPFYRSYYTALGPARQLDVLPLTDDATEMYTVLQTLVGAATCRP